MPRPTKTSACVVNTSVSQENSVVSQESSGSDVKMDVQSPQYSQPSTSQSQPFVQPMFMPYIEGPNVVWTVNDSLYHRFLKWKMKSKNILDCELAMIPESKKCKKIIAWRSNFGMDQYVSWCLPIEYRTMEVIRAKYGDFCKPQTNEVRAKFDLLTSFRQGNHSVDEWYTAVQAQVSLAKYPPETEVSCIKIFPCFFLKYEDLFPKPLMIPI